MAAAKKARRLASSRAGAKRKTAPAKRKASVKRTVSTKRKAPAKRKWSGAVRQHSDALDLQQNVFTWHDPKRIARSLKQSAEHSRRRKAGPYQSAVSMLTFYINRGGHNLPAAQKRVLDQAKTELRHLFGRA